MKDKSFENSFNTTMDSLIKEFINKNPYEHIYEILDYRFENCELLKQALTRQSAIGERNPNASEKSYQRLEFFGDSIISLIITELIYDVFPEKSEENLTPLRSDIVKNDTLAELAIMHNLGNYLIIGRGEEKQKLRQNKNILADIIEAIVAAVYLDCNKNYEKTKRIVLKFFEVIIIEKFKKLTYDKNQLKKYLSLNNINDENLNISGNLSNTQDNSYINKNTSICYTNFPKKQEEDSAHKNEKFFFEENVAFEYIENFKTILKDNNEVLDINEYIPKIKINNSYEFVMEFIAREMHKNNNDIRTEISDLNKRNEENLKTMQVKQQYITTKFLMSTLLLDKFIEKKDLELVEIYYYKIFSEYLNGFCIEDIYKLLEISEEILDDLNDESQKAKKLKIKLMILKLNLKLKLIDNLKQKNNSTNNFFNISKFDVDDILNYINNNKFNDNNEILFFFRGVKIKYYFYVYKNSNYLSNIKHEIENNMNLFEKSFSKIKEYNELDNLTLFEYASVKIIEIKMSSNDQLNKINSFEIKLQNLIEETSKNTEENNPLNIIFFEVYKYHLEYLIQKGKEEDYKEFIKYNNLLYNFIVENFGLYSNHFEEWYKNSKNFLDTLKIIENKDNNDEF